MNAYQAITDRICELLERGTVPWRRPWSRRGKPYNLVSGHRYRGVNVLLLSAAAYESPAWLTYRQAKAAGGHVRRGERGLPVIFWHWTERKEDDGRTTRIPFLRRYTVFNVSQCEGIEAPEAPAVEWDPVRHAEDLVATYVTGEDDRPSLSHDGGDAAFYRPSSDSIHLPARARFQSAAAYYGTLFHELGHSTGHESRLARPGLTNAVMFGDHTYSEEELVAEMASAFLCAECGLDVEYEQNAAYVDYWLGRLRGDRRLVVVAAARAQRAADLVLGETREAHGEIEESDDREAA